MGTARSPFQQADVRHTFQRYENFFLDWGRGCTLSEAFVE